MNRNEGWMTCGHWTRSCRAYDDMLGYRRCSQSGFEPANWEIRDWQWGPGYLAWSRPTGRNAVAKGGTSQHWCRSAWIAAPNALDGFRNQILISRV
mmetsp:Transcript_54267/g.110770  ORF Transcript_54267/g.110770 Transcript_54267/m.110770 type:complete len:96 (+) Transcript_54267:171-458(+)